MKFFNTLPEPPVEPKLLDVQWPLERLVAYAPTSLERDYKHEMLLGPNLGIVIDMVNPSSYMLPDQPGPLDAADEELLMAEKETLAKRDRRGQPKKPLTVPWLRKSEFITAVFDENLYNQSSGGAQEVVRAAQNPSASSARAALQTFATAGVAAVARQFVRANDGSRPVHPKDPSMVPVSVQPVLPCLEFVGHSLTHVLFEDAPVTERDAAEERRAALLLPQEIPGSNKMVVVRVLPNEADDLDDLFGGSGGGVADGAPKEYHKSQAHSADNVVNMAGKYALLWGPNRAAAEFVPFERKLELRELSFHFRGALPVVHRRFKVAKRAMTEEELESAREAKRQVFAPADEEEDGGGTCSDLSLLVVVAVGGGGGVCRSRWCARSRRGRRSRFARA